MMLTAKSVARQVLSRRARSTKQPSTPRRNFNEPPHREEDCRRRTARRLGPRARRSHRLPYADALGLPELRLSLDRMRPAPEVDHLGLRPAAAHRAAVAV